MSRIEISLRGEDPDVRSRLINLKVHAKEVITPRRSLCLTSAQDSEARMLRKNPSITAINELPREINKRILEDIDDDKDKQEAFYRDIRYRFAGMNTSGEVTVFVFSYNNKGQDERNKQPTQAETEFLCSILNHPFNDVLVPPIIPKLPGKSYIPYLNEFFNQVQSYQKIAFAGLIPHIARLEIRHLAEFYARQGINYFVMDFASKNPLDLVGNINEVLKMVDLIEKECNTQCFLHAVNVPITKAHWKSPVVPTKDILLFEMGFNCFGSSHIPRQLPFELAVKMKSTTKRPFRLFNRKDYGYYRDDTPGLRDMLLEDQPTALSIDDFRRGLTWREIGNLEKLFNVERHGLESNEIRKRLIEGESMAEYIQAKAQIPDGYVKKVLRIGKRQSTLS